MYIHTSCGSPQLVDGLVHSKHWGHQLESYLDMQVCVGITYMYVINHMTIYQNMYTHTL